MRDIPVEDRLRSHLRAEGDALPFTITVEELERRFAARRRARSDRRISLLAAAVAAVAIGTVFGLSNGLFDGFVVGDDRTPAPSLDPVLTPAPTDPILSTPSPSPSESPSRVANPIGAMGEAILVRPIGADPTRPDTLEITRLDPASGRSDLLATFPGSILGDDGRLDSFDRPSVSNTGWLAIPFVRGPNVDEESPAIVIVDVAEPSRDPWILDGYRPLGWEMTDKLVVERAGDGTIALAWPLSPFIEPYVVTDRSIMVDGRSVTTQDGTRFLATQGDTSTPGFVDFRGLFTPTIDLPPVYQRTGAERRFGAGAHGLAWACPCSGLRARPDDVVWAADGRSAWLVVARGGDGAGTTIASLRYLVGAVGTPEERARVEVPILGSTRILGIADEPAAGAATVIAIGDADGTIRAFVLGSGMVVEQDGTAWFAGWAADPPPYDPD